MNPLLGQFILEARDLLEETSKGLLQLESNPDNMPVINGVFRAMHTLKGSSGLFEPDFLPLTKVAHAGEDLLDAVRNRELPFSSKLTDLLLESMDLISQWLDEIEGAEKLPAAALADGVQFAAKLRAALGKAPDVEEVVGKGVGKGDHEGKAAPSGVGWLSSMSAQKLAEAAKKGGSAAMTALCYEPDPSAFFFGEDPFYLVRQIPEIILFHMEAREPWPAVDGLDPYQCNLRFMVVSCGPLAELTHLFRYVGEQVQFTAVTVADLRPPSPAPSGGALSGSSSVSRTDSEVFQAILAEQLFILSLPCDAGCWRGRLVSMGKFLTNCFQRMGFTEAIAPLEKVIKESESVRNFEPVRVFLAPMVTGIPKKETQKTSLPSLAPPVSQAEAAAPQAEPSATKILKIDQSRIDRMLDLVGELVVAKNSLPFLASRAEKEYHARRLGQEILEYYGVINQLTEELQASVMQVRMLPVSSIFQRFPRLVRDISRKLGKNIQLVMEGEETEADKNIIEVLSDPMIHLVRNSLDHGIEDPSARRAAGKPEEGQIRLSAFQEGDRVIIEIRDDGKGVDPAVIKAKAYEKGLIDEERVENITDQEAIQLIFAPGFSTAEQISDLSGRGVGMDVVNTTLKRVGGRVFVNSVKGEWTLVRLELPMTMAITRVMLIELAGAMYGVPLEIVVETVRVERSDIHRVKQQEATVLRGRLLPLVRLRDLLGLSSDENGRREEAVLVVRPTGEEIGLIVDDFQKGMDIVLKPLEGILTGLPGYSGGALMGDGRVLLVLNLKELL